MTDASQAIHPPPQEFSAEEIAQDAILRFFHYAHLPPALQARSKPFCDLARQIIDTTPRNAERTVALRKLLEAKDAGVRAHDPLITNQWVGQRNRQESRTNTGGKRERRDNEGRGSAGLRPDWA